MELTKTKYKQTEVGLIPEDWEISKIDSKIDLLTGFPFPSNKYSSSGIRLLRGSNIKRGNTDWSQDITQYWENISPEIKKYELKENDIVIAMDGSLVGRSFAQLKTTDLPALLLQRVARIRSEKVDINYLKEYVCSIYFTEHCDKVKTSSAIPHISPKDIRDFVIPFPPTKKEQKAIAQVLSDTDTLIQTLEQKLAKKRAIKQGAMQQLLTPKEDWEVRGLGDFLSYEQPTKYIVSDTDYNANYDIPVLTAGKSFILGYTNERAGIFNDLPVIIFDDFTTATQFVDFRFKVKSSAMKILKKRNDTVNIRFVYELMQQIVFPLGDHKRHWIGEYQHIEVLVPDSDEQTRIATILSDMDAEIAQLEQKLDKFKLLKQGLMQELLTGRIRLI